MKKGNHHMKWMNSAMVIGTFVMSLMFACILFSLFYFSISNSTSDQVTHHMVSTVELEVQPSNLLEENSTRPVSEIIVGIEEQNSSALGENNQDSKTAVEEIKEVKTQITKPSCTSNYLTEVCEIQGDQIRIHGISSSVFFKTDSKNNKTWRVQPYPRKYDTTMMTRIPKVKITRLYDPQETSKCELNHNITAVIFAVGGYTGNFYHDFTDVLVPLFITARQFEGVVQFFITNIQLWWVNKYSQILNKLSNYEIINFEKENNTHCYPRVIVGLYSHKDMSMDPSKDNYSAVDFTKFLRSVYSLERDSPISLRQNTERRPRLLIIPRKNSRSLTNMNKIVPMAEELGFEVASNESNFHTNVGDFARIVNSFDVLMGVHGAGLTNLVFLPTKAVLIQIVPFGNLESMCDHVFGEPARDMKLKYLQYNISEEESTLSEKYARDHPVFRDPDTLHKKGWDVMTGVYLRKQSVQLNITRFRPILEKARELLSESV